MIKFQVLLIGRCDGEIRYKWNSDFVNRMLDNKVYLGHLQYGKRINLSYKSKKKKYIPPEEWKIVYNTHKPIISEELFNLVQDLKRINQTTRRKKHEWELNGFVKCKECGAKMTLKVEYKRNHPNELKSKRVCCLNGLKKYKGKECIKGSRGINEADLNKIVYDDIKEAVKQLVKKNTLRECIKEQSYKNTFTNLENNKEFLNKELKKIEDEIKELYEDFRNQLLDEDDYKKFYQEKANQKNRIKKELQIIENEIEKKPVLDEKKLNEIIQEIINMKGLKKDIISEIIYDIQIDDENRIYINYKYDIFKGVA